MHIHSYERHVQTHKRGEYYSNDKRVCEKHSHICSISNAHGRADEGVPGPISFPPSTRSGANLLLSPASAVLPGYADGFGRRRDGHGNADAEK